MGDVGRYPQHPIPQYEYVEEYLSTNFTTCGRLFTHNQDKINKLPTICGYSFVAEKLFTS